VEELVTHLLEELILMPPGDAGANALMLEYHPIGLYHRVSRVSRVGRVSRVSRVSRFSRVSRVSR
jgi:hypothetical protein